jgi:membrane peptidoglycan carboxypeptidase
MVPWGQDPFRWRAAEGDWITWASAGQFARSVTVASRHARRKARRTGRWLVLGPPRFLVAAAVILSLLVAIEVRTSWVQAHTLASVGQRIDYPVGPGPSPSVRYPAAGPFNLRLGYTRLPDFIHRLQGQGFLVAHQARWTPTALAVVDSGLFPIYEEKARAGLHIVDRDDRPLWVSARPARVYERFEDIPPLVVRSLLFVENRALLDERMPTRNPAVEYPRLGKAVLDVVTRLIRPGHPVSGGSTLATQLEKVRHAPGGRTDTLADKGRQMASASLRAYRDGEHTTVARHAIVRDYVNSLPLGAVAGWGEVTGLADGLWAWYGADVDAVNRVLRDDPAWVAAADSSVGDRSLAYRQALSLLLAARRPTAYLVGDPTSLDRRVDAYLHLLADAGIIPPPLRDASLAARPQLRRRVDVPTPAFASRKGVDGVRIEILNRLGLSGTYDLDRFDLAVRTSIDGPATDEVARRLAEVSDPATARAAGLLEGRLLGGSAPDGVIYSFTLYERTPQGHLLRIQADTHDQPLNMNDGTRLELGSTAKLRTLATYLEIVATLHTQYAGLPLAELRALRFHSRDRLRAWAADYLIRTDTRGIEAMIEAALARRYSASPAESFFTGGGLHTFGNFDARHNRASLTVREAFRDSVNLVFVRLMRDIVSFHLYGHEEWAGVLHDPAHPARAEYLARFADREGREFLRRFHEQHAAVPPPQALEALAARAGGQPTRLAAIFRAVLPDAPVAAFESFLRTHARGVRPTPARLEAVFAQADPARWNWQDLGYLARVHPLELWLVRYLHQRPGASLADAVDASADVRQAAYRWLFTTRHARARQRAVETLVEAEAFTRVHEAWRRQGYPFASLVPSLATALGSSGDNPTALSALLGLIQNDGVRVPLVRITDIRFGDGTPYDTRLARQPVEGERVWPAEVAGALRRELVGVVEHGSGRRLAGGLALEGDHRMAIGGKTGTGDNRFVTTGRDGRRSRVVNRTASFAFTIGDRYFGTIVAFVPGPEAADYRFTSALPVQLMKHLLPALGPVVERPAA